MAKQRFGKPAPADQGVEATSPATADQGVEATSPATADQGVEATSPRRWLTWAKVVHGQLLQAAEVLGGMATEACRGMRGGRAFGLLLASEQTRLQELAKRLWEIVPKEGGS